MLAVGRLFVISLTFLLNYDSVWTHNELDLNFLMDYLSYKDPMTQQYSVITCRQPEDINIVRMISESLKRFVNFHEADKSLQMPTNELTTFILNVCCSSWMDILHQGSRLNLFRKPFQWLLFGLNMTVDDGEAKQMIDSKQWNVIEKLPLLLDSDFNVVSKNKEGKFTVMATYKIYNDGEWIRENLAEWTPGNQLKIFNYQSIAMRRWNLQGLIMPATLVITDLSSINHMEDLVDRHKDTTSKVTFNFIKLLEFLFNLTLNCRIDDVWGIPLENGSWTGMMGDLQRGDVILGASPLFFSDERLKLVEYYAMVTPTKVRFIFISPPLSHSRNIFALPFAQMVWICCLSTFLIACVSLFVAFNIEEEKVNSENYKTDQLFGQRKGFSLSDIIVCNIGAICQQGTAAQTYKPAGRIITFFTYLTYMFLYISYSASIVAILQSSDTSIQTLFDLMRSPMKAGADDVAYSQYYFKSADDDLRKMFYKTKIHPNKKQSPNFYSPEDGIKKVRQGLFAYHVETSVGYQIIQKTFTEEEKCGLQELSKSFLPREAPWLVMKKHNPYSELVRIGAKRAIETGFKTRYVRRYYTKKPNCGSKSSRFLTVGLIDCQPAFLFLLYGIAISLTVFIAEILIKRYFKKCLESPLIQAVCT